MGTQLWYIHALDAYSAIKRSAALKRAQTWVALANITLRSQLQSPSIVLFYLGETSRIGQFTETRCRYVVTRKGDKEGNRE